MAKFTKKEEPKATPKKTPMVVDIYGIVKDKTFKTAKDVPMSFFGTFEDCTFEMDELKDRNFFSAKFVDCTFVKGFTFVNCNLGDATGIEDAELVGCHAPPHAPKKKR